mgnify:CR=1 FL=1
MRFILLLLSFLSLSVVQAPADDSADIVTGHLRPGWRLADGTHMAALHLRLAPGWKTYWRAPGDAGIPPVFDWRSTRNLRSVSVLWPTPIVFHQSGLRSVGYKDEVILPLRIELADPTRDARLRAIVDIGVCEDVCVPMRLRVSADLPATGGRLDGAIAAALADQPISAEDAGIGPVRCRIAPLDDGMRLIAQIPVPQNMPAMEAVIETADPYVWVAEPAIARDAGTITATTDLIHVDGGPFALDRSGLRFTLLGRDQTVDIRGCTG